MSKNNKTLNKYKNRYYVIFFPSDFTIKKKTTVQTRNKYIIIIDSSKIHYIVSTIRNNWTRKIEKRKHIYIFIYINDTRIIW